MIRTVLSIIGDLVWLLSSAVFLLAIFSKIHVREKVPTLVVISGIIGFLISAVTRSFWNEYPSEKISTILDILTFGIPCAFLIMCACLPEHMSAKKEKFFDVITEILIIAPFVAFFIGISIRIWKIYIPFF